MVAVQPKTIAESLSKRIAGYQYEKSVPDLVLRGFKRDANKLKDISPTYAHHFLGQIAALEYNADRVIHHYDTALRYDEDSTLYYNYAVSLMRVGKNELALKNLKEGFKLLDNDINLVGAYLNAFSSFLSLSYANKLIPLLTKYRVELPESIHNMLNFFSTEDVRENILEDLMVRTRDTIYSHHLLLSPTVKYQKFDSSLNMSFEISHFDDFEQVFNCNYQILEIKVDLEDKYNVDLGNILISCEVV